MNAVTGLGVIENAGPNHLRGFLRQHMKSAKGVDIAVAFVSQAGLADLLPVLKKASMNGPVRLLTGLYQCFTEPEALRILLAEQVDTDNRLSVRLSTDPHFHWKAYFLLKSGKATAVVGSSNLTAEGLGGSGEFNAVFSMPTNSPAYQSLHKPFEEEWRSAVPLHEEQVERYAKARPNVVKVFRPTISLKDILGSHQQVKSEVKVERQYWRDWISGPFADKTEAILRDYTNWEDRDYCYYASREPRHRKGDHILLFDCEKQMGYVYLAEVVATTRIPVVTPDGQHFTAYRKVAKSHRRKLVKSLWLKLRSSSSGLSKGAAQGGKKLTPAVFEQLRKTLEC